MKYRILIFITMVVTILITITACDRREPDKQDFVPFPELVVSDNFDFSTIRYIDVNLEAYNNQGEALTGLVFKIYDHDPEANGNLLASGVIDANGKFQTKISVPTAIKQLYVVGYMQTVVLPIINNRVEKIYGGNLAPQGNSNKLKGNSKDYVYLPWLTYSANGTPSPMTFEALSPAFLSNIVNTFPERANQTVIHPQFFSSNVNRNIRTLDECDLYITFVHDGAAYQNAIGFYTYNVGTTVNSVSDIEPLTIVFPNASIVGGGGGLRPGDRVYLGHIPANKMVGWFLLANGYQGGANVNDGLYRFFSNNNLNPEANASQRAHTVMVYDPMFHRLVLGFEDKFRGPGGGSDHDFNDVMFSIEVTPEIAINPGDYPIIIPPADLDGDGVPDDEDDYPTDPTKAFNNYTPSEFNWGTLAYEDLWPIYGDYDFNDLVIDYNINQITNGFNRVSYIESKYKVVAIGARHKNGFAIEYPFNAANITNLTCSHPYWTLETGGPRAVLRLFDSAFYLIPQVVGGAFINTETAQPFHNPVQINVNFKLVTPLPPATFIHQPPYNPFIFKYGNRAHEIHLPGYAPTTLVDASLFGTGSDGTNPVLGRFYYSRTNLPYALNIANRWNYPLEKVQITKGYLKFKDWAQSNGALYPDWYDNNPGYLNPLFIYNRP